MPGSEQGQFGRNLRCIPRNHLKTAYSPAPKPNGRAVYTSTRTCAVRCTFERMPQNARARTPCSRYSFTSSTTSMQHGWGNPSKNGPTSQHVGTIRLAIELSEWIRVRLKLMVDFWSCAYRNEGDWQRGTRQLPFLDENPGIWLPTRKCTAPRRWPEMQSTSY